MNRKQVSKPQPATPLPARIGESRGLMFWESTGRTLRDDEMARVVQCVNAYPRLLAERAELLRVVKHFAAMSDVLSVAENEQIASLLRRIEGAE